MSARHVKAIFGVKRRELPGTNHIQGLSATNRTARLRFRSPSGSLILCILRVALLSLFRINFLHDAPASREQDTPPRGGRRARGAGRAPPPARRDSALARDTRAIRARVDSLDCQRAFFSLAKLMLNTGKL